MDVLKRLSAKLRRRVAEDAATPRTDNRSERLPITKEASARLREAMDRAVIRCKGTAPLSEWKGYDRARTMLDKLVDVMTIKTPPALNRSPAMDQLQIDATAYHNHLMHSYWYAFKDSWIKAGLDAPEPPRGNPAMKDRYEEYLAKIGKGSPATLELRIPDMYEQYAPTWRKTPPSLVIQGKRYPMKEGKVVRE